MDLHCSHTEARFAIRRYSEGPAGLRANAQAERPAPRRTALACCLEGQSRKSYEPQQEKEQRHTGFIGTQPVACLFVAGKEGLRVR
jgi:hypothetical protein